MLSHKHDGAKHFENRIDIASPETTEKNNDKDLADQGLNTCETVEAITWLTVFDFELFVSTFAQNSPQLQLCYHFEGVALFNPTDHLLGRVIIGDETLQHTNDQATKDQVGFSG